METFIAQLLEQFETGKIGRRDLIQKLTLAAVAVSRAPAPAGGFKTIGIDHISYEVVNYKRTRDFYADLMGMTVSEDNGTNQCELHFGDSMIIARNRPASVSRTRVDHIAYRIADWDTNKVKEELDRRKLQPRLDTGQTKSPTNFSSFHVQDPDGFDLQITGVVKPGDSQYRK